MEQSRAYSKAAGKKWFRFFRTGPLPIGTESYRQILPPLNFIRLSSGLHDNKYPRGVFETAERITKLREKTFSRSDLILRRAALKLNYRNWPCGVFGVVVYVPTNATAQQAVYTFDLLYQRKL